MSDDDLNDDFPVPYGQLSLQTITMPADTNASGDIFGGWLVSQMDMAAAIAALEITQSRVATVAINSMAFLTPVHVGAVISCYTDIVDIGRSSIRINVEVWIKHKTSFELTKVTEGEFVFVALDEHGRTRIITKK